MSGLWPKKPSLIQAKAFGLDNSWIQQTPYCGRIFTGKMALYR